MSDMLAHFADVDARFAVLLQEAGSFLSESERSEIDGDLRANEFGLALETLWYAVASSDIPEAVRLEFWNLADKMGMTDIFGTASAQ